MNIFKNILSIISDISNNKYTADNSIEIGDWIIIDVKLFNKYKNKITINNINYIDSSIVNSLEEYAFKDIRVSFETKKQYGILKYNTNFIAFLLYDKEYEILLKPINLIAINKNISDNYEQKNNKPPNIKDILDILKWKITEKALQDYKYKIT
jgi:hypothetical protein